MNYSYRFMRFPGGKPKAVTFSYDDATKFDKPFVEILDKYGIKCTFNIPSAWIEEPSEDAKHLTADEIKTLLCDGGHEIAVHCAHHRAPGQFKPIEIIKDVLENRLELEKITGGIVRGMAYPNSGITKMENGLSYENIKSYLTDLDIAYSRTLGGDNDSFAMPNDWHAWMPTAHHINPKVFEYIEKFVAFDPTKVYLSSRSPRLFYLWGHSYEFDRDNNWDRLEKICEMLGGKDDTWYVTNIEIYDYTMAYNSLVYSADASKIYNPTLKEVWFEINNEIYSVKSGETLDLG